MRGTEGKAERVDRGKDLGWRERERRGRRKKEYGRTIRRGADDIENGMGSCRGGRRGHVKEYPKDNGSQNKESGERNGGRTEGRNRNGKKKVV